MNPASSSTSEVKSVPATSAVLRERDDRLESLKLLTNQLGHDFNNYLSPILGYVSLIKEDVTAGSLAHQYATALENAARKTEALIDSVLMASRPQRRYQPRTCDFTQLIDKTLTEWHGALPETAQIQLKKSLTPCTLDVEPVLWRETLIQLFKNARFALATGGILEVSLRPQKLTRTEAAELGVSRSETYLLIVRDDGFGMPPNVKAHAFDPFFTTRLKTQGQGLGLTLVHSVVRLHGGQVMLDSAEDLGTTVRIWLPAAPTATPPAAVAVPAADVPAKPAAPVLAASQSAALAAPSPSTRDTAMAGKKVLLVDDDPLVLEVLKAFLQRSHFEVIIAQDGHEAWRLYQRHAEDLALVITDITMPKLGGIELSQQIRQNHKGTKIVLISGDADATRTEALAHIPDPLPPLVRKPFSLKSFMEVIRQQLD